MVFPFLSLDEKCMFLYEEPSPSQFFNGNITSQLWCNFTADVTTDAGQMHDNDRAEPVNERRQLFQAIASVQDRKD